MAFTKDNLGAYICDAHGFIKFIGWKHDAITEQDFESQNQKRVANSGARQLCLTKEDKNLLLVFSNRLRVFDT